MKAVMNCVLHLVKEAGNDLAANSILNSFHDFCLVNPKRPKTALKLIKKFPTQWLSFIVPTLISGAAVQMSLFFEEAINFTKNENLETRKQAIFSLGKINYRKDFTHMNKVFIQLKQLAYEETDDQLLACIVKSVFSLYINDNLFTDKAIALIKYILPKGKQCVINVAAELFSFQSDRLTEKLVNILIPYLMQMGAINSIDAGISNLMEQGDTKKNIELLEFLLLAYPNDLLVQQLDSVIYQIKNKGIINTMLTRWFLKGDAILCESIEFIVNRIREADIVCDVSPSELANCEMQDLIFIAEKSVGYLFYDKITPVRIIISLIRHANEETANKLGSLLFELLLLNFPISLSEYLTQQAKLKTGLAQKVIESILNKFNNYSESLMSIGTIKALHPSQAQEEASYRRQARIILNGIKEAHKKSPLLSSITKLTLLYGRKFISYSSSLNGQSNRTEIPLHNIRGTTEIPQLAHIDPFGLDYKLRVLRAREK